MEKKQHEFQKTIYIEGIGSITEEGKLDVEKWIKRLLQSKYIAG